MESGATVAGDALTEDTRARVEGDRGGKRRGATLLRDAALCDAGDHGRARVGGGDRINLEDRSPLPDRVGGLGLK